MFGFGQKGGPEPREDEALPREPVVPVQPTSQPDEDYREVLIDRIDGIDRTKRDIKGQIHSAAITAKAQQCSVDQVWLRRAKDKMDHLTREREEIRKALHAVNERIKEQRRADNSQRKRRLTIGEAFMQVAREQLPPERYEAVLVEASERVRGEEESAQEGGEGEGSV